VDAGEQLASGHGRRQGERRPTRHRRSGHHCQE
jgi:hypothetical protein